MVASLLLVGLDVGSLAGVDMEVGRAATAEEAYASLSQRAWDVVLAGRVPDAPPEALLQTIARRYPSTPVVLVGEFTAPVREAAWEVVAAGASPVLETFRRAAEVARLRREVARLRAEREDRPQSRADLARTFEQGSIRDMERLMIMERLSRMNQNRTHSAASLDISVRTLRNKLREYREESRVPVSPGEAS
jgi:DNA-binding NtrC family response regulator